MAIPGYDVDDLDAMLKARLEDEGGVQAALSDEECARYESGEALLDILDSAEVGRLLGKR